MRDSRGFGVELEFNTRNAPGVIGNRRDWAARIINDVSVSSRRWRGGHDGSELEFKSPILRGSEGFRELRRVMDALVKAGCSTNHYDGLHIHHDAPEFVGNKANVLRLVKSWKENQREIEMFVSRRRRGSYGSCPEWTDHLINRLENDGDHINDWYGRNSLNIDALRKHGSIEIRLHEGTLAYEKAEAWIRFGQKFLASCLTRKNPIAPVNNGEILLNRIRYPEKPKRVLMRAYQQQ